MERTLYICGRCRRRSDREHIVEAFQVSVDLENLCLPAEDDIAPGSIQPIVLIDDYGERKIEMMRWGFKFSDHLLFNARSEGIDTARFLKENFAKRCCIVPADTQALSQLEAMAGAHIRRSTSMRLPNLIRAAQISQRTLSRR